MRRGDGSVAAAGIACASRRLTLWARERIGNVSRASQKEEKSRRDTTGLNNLSSAFNTAHIALGANLGDRHRNIKAALDILRGTEGVQIRAVSELIETDAVGGPPGQPRYLNGAAVLDTTLSAGALLSLLLVIENMQGRVRPEDQRDGPRTLDLDLLLFGGKIINESGLRIPHPRMHEREFVLRPLAQIDPDAMHPELHKTISELLNSLQ